MSADLWSLCPTLEVREGEEGPAIGLEESEPGVVTWVDHRNNPMAHGRILNGTYWMDVLGRALFRFGPDDPVVTAFPAPDTKLIRITDSFYRHITPLWFHIRGRSVLHGSAVSTPGSLLALCAEPNTGKSTLAYGLSLRGYPLYADDAVAFRIHDGEAEARSLPFFLRLRKASAHHFGTDVRKLHEPDAWKDPTPPPTTRLMTICLLERLPDKEDQPTVEVVPVRAVESFRSLFDHTLSFGLGDIELKKNIMRQHLELAAHVPLVRVRFASRLNRIEEVFDALEELVEEQGRKTRPIGRS